MPKNSNHYQKLKDKWVARHKNLQKHIFSKHRDSFEWLINNSKELALGTLVGMFILTTPVVNKAEQVFASEKLEVNREIDQSVFLTFDLKNVLPQEVRKLTPLEEERVKEVLKRSFNVNVASEMSGRRLNTTYGIIGQEQHLARFPGDNINIHFESGEEAENFAGFGLAPGRGAWGYFANSQEEMTKDDLQREKYYIAVQTFLSKGFKDTPEHFINFFKYKKMLVVNPQNGKAVVVVIADSGPAVWTGKQLGGSPEVMRYLQRVDGSQKGAVLYFFVDDPENKIPLGPVSL